MGAKPETDFSRDTEVRYLYGVSRLEKMVFIFAELSEAKDGFPQKDNGQERLNEWERLKAKYYGDYTASGLVHEIRCLVKPLDDEDKEALKKLVSLAKSGIELRKNLTFTGRKVESRSYELKDCFTALPDMLGDSTQRMAKKLDDFELNWLRTFVFFAGGKVIDERKSALIKNVVEGK